MTTMMKKKRISTWEEVLEPEPETEERTLMKVEGTSSMITLKSSKQVTSKEHTCEDEMLQIVESRLTVNFHKVAEQRGFGVLGFWVLGFGFWVLGLGFRV